jgi:hypothetical protein
MTDSHDLLLDLNFVPAWARQPPSTSRQPETGASDRGEAPRRWQDRDGRDRRNDRRDGSPRRPRPERGGDGRRFDRDHGRPPRSGEPAGTDGRSGAARERPRPPEPLPLAISFLPERHGLKPLISHLAKTGRAYPLLELAAMFLSKPDYYAVKLEPAPATEGKPPLALWQCAACSAVFLDRSRVETHALRAHFDAYYATEQRPGETPKGQFKCVAKCGLSGQILGPPNYHGYNERLLELHRTRFASMSLEDYRKRIVNESDPALIEQWKQDASTQTVFRTLQAPEPREFTRRAEVETHFLETYAPKLVRGGDRFIIGGIISRQLEDSRLRAAIEEEWARECRFPWRLSIVLRPAFRQHKLHLFKASDRHWFVSPIAPAPLDPAATQTTPVVREILDCLNTRPGITRQDVASALRPEAPPDSPEAAALIHEILCLRDRGHIIEFHDGRLAVPRMPGRAGAAKAGLADTAAAADNETLPQEPPSHG